MFLSSRCERAEATRFHPLAFASLLFLSVFSPPAAALCGAEAALSKISADKLEQEWPLRPSADPVSTYLQRLGARLAPRQEIISPGQYLTWDWPSEWRFRTVRDLAPNAFSIGDGRTYVTDGSIRAAASEAEIAAILAHEMGHQLAQHFCSNSEESGGRIRSVGSLHQVIDVGREMEADRIAMDILRAAGFPPGAMLDVVRRMNSKDSVSLRQRQQREQEILNQLRGTQILPVPSSSEDFAAIQQILRSR
jgi:predicted Zn-dependent protease